MKRLRKIAILLFATTALAACGEANTLDSEFADDTSIFGAAAKADGLSIVEGGYDAQAVLKVANELSLVELDDTAKLDARAARNIVSTRDANGPFATLHELDAVPYVGVNAITAMRIFAQESGWIGFCGDDIINGAESCDGAAQCDARCGLDDGPDIEEPAELIHGVAVGSYEALGMLAVANTETADSLDDTVNLDSRAVSRIINARPIADLKALDAVGYVGARAFARLLDFAQAEGHIPSCGDGTINAPIETCDDGNTLANDGCSARCLTEDDNGGGEDNGALVHGIREGSADAVAVLKVANGATLEVLDDTVRLDARSARAIVNTRADRDIATLIELDALPYVGQRAFDRLLDYAHNGDPIPTCGDGSVDEGETCDDGNTDADDGCDAVCQIEAPSVDSVVFEGPEQCSGQRTSYTYSVISNPPRATSDGQIVLRYSSSSPYGPRSQRLSIQTGAHEWTEVFVTNEGSSWQTQTVRISADMLNAGIDAMGWIRFRVNPGTSYTSCSQLSLTYNCPECLACPDGQEDLGFGCQDIGAPYNQTQLDHRTGRCGRSTSTVTFIGSPEPGSDGELSFQWLPCDGGSIRLSINTRNAGWLDIGDSQTGRSCGFVSTDLTIPEAYLDAARNGDGEIEIRYAIQDSCRPGMGCASYNDPCVRQMNLQFSQR